MKKTKKIILWILIGILSLILVLSGVVLYYYQLHIKPQIESFQATANTKNLLEGLSAEKLFDDVEELLKDEEIQKYIDENQTNQSANLLNMVEDAKKKKEEQKTESNAQPNSPTEKPKSKYEQIIEVVEPKDLTDGLSLAGRADVGYILGLLSGGLTPEEKRELKIYLKERYSSSEISKGIELFSKYSHLL